MPNLDKLILGIAGMLGIGLSVLEIGKLGIEIGEGIESIDGLLLIKPKGPLILGGGKSGLATAFTALKKDPFLGGVLVGINGWPINLIPSGIVVEPYFSFILLSLSMIAPGSVLGVGIGAGAVI